MWTKEEQKLNEREKKQEPNKFSKPFIKWCADGREKKAPKSLHMPTAWILWINNVNATHCKHQIVCLFHLAHLLSHRLLFSEVCMGLSLFIDHWISRHFSDNSSHLLSTTLKRVTKIPPFFFSKTPILTNWMPRALLAYIISLVFPFCSKKEFQWICSFCFRRGLFRILSSANVRSELFLVHLIWIIS